jgi:hypothetical protein
LIYKVKNIKQKKLFFIKKNKSFVILIFFYIFVEIKLKYMGPASSTSTIPQFCINYIKHQNSLGIKVTRSDLKNALKQQLETAPWLFGTSRGGTEPASWHSSVYPTFRSMYSRMKKGTGGSAGLEGYLRVIVFDGIDYIFDLDDTYLKATLGRTFKQQFEGEEIKPTDIHTTLQYKICSVAVAGGYKIFVPFKNRNVKIENGLTINSSFGENMVDNFIGMTNITREIDVIILEEKEDGFYPVRSYEVENSTGVVSGISRMMALNCHGVIVSPHKQYKEKFESYMKESFKDIKNKVSYKSSREIFKLAETIEEYQYETTDLDEIKILINEKF